MPGNDCSNPMPIACGDCFPGNTYGYTNSHNCGYGHDGTDRLFELLIPYEQEVRIVGEADFDADWTLATVCDPVVGDLFCDDFGGIQTDPTCSSLTHNDYGYWEFTQVLTPGLYYIWVDSWAIELEGNFVLEVLCIDPTPTPTSIPTNVPTATPTATPTDVPTGSPSPTPTPTPLNPTVPATGPVGLLLLIGAASMMLRRRKRD